MRWLMLLCVLATAACADPSQWSQAAQPSLLPLWQRPGGLELASADAVSRAEESCAQEMAPEALYDSSVPSPSPWLDANRPLLDSPAFGEVSDAEMNTCMHSQGYERIPE